MIPYWLSFPMTMARNSARPAVAMHPDRRKGSPLFKSREFSTSVGSPVNVDSFTRKESDFNKRPSQGILSPASTNDNLINGDTRHLFLDRTMLPPRDQSQFVAIHEYDQKQQ